MQILRRAPAAQEKAGIIGEERLREFYGQRKMESCKKEQYKESDFGLAVDIGTTTVSISLYQLLTKKYMGSLQERNRQTSMGSDVMMRLMHCQRGHQGKMQEMLVEQLEQMASSLSGGVCQLRDIKKMAVVGNTTMCHIFAGQDISGLAGSPFRPSYQGSFTCRGRELGFHGIAQTEIYILAGVDAHVGADAVSVAMTLGLWQNKQIQLAVDIGTNAELLLSDGQGGVLVCSVPAGPAFEGMEISCGMRGVAGAVAGVRFAPQAGNLILDVIDDRLESGAPISVPRGLCGSGLVDVVAQLRQCGLVRGDGYLLSKQEAVKEKIPAFLSERLEDIQGERGFTIYRDVECEKNVVLMQQDIRQFQLAKAAVQAGIKVLLSSQGIALSQVEQIWIAGMFGGHISRKSAVQTGLFPDAPPERLSVVGNAAGEGAALALLCPEFCRDSEQLARKAKHLELADSEVFQKQFMEAIELG